jgi:hypothetical protein
LLLSTSRLVRSSHLQGWVRGARVGEQPVWGPALKAALGLLRHQWRGPHRQSSLLTRIPSRFRSIVQPPLFRTSHPPPWLRSSILQPPNCGGLASRQSTDVWNCDAQTTAAVFGSVDDIVHQINLQPCIHRSSILPSLPLAAPLLFRGNRQPCLIRLYPPHDDYLRYSFGLDSPAPFHFLISPRIRLAVLPRPGHTLKPVYPPRSLVHTGTDHPVPSCLDIAVSGDCVSPPRVFPGDILSCAHGCYSHYGERRREKDVVCKGMWPSISHLHHRLVIWRHLADITPYSGRRSVDAQGLQAYCYRR